MGWSPAPVQDWFAPGPPAPPWMGPAPQEMGPAYQEGPEGLIIPGTTTRIPAPAGRRLEVYRFMVDYKGPSTQVVLGWGLKPAAGLFQSIDFNNGGGLVDGFFAFSSVISLPQSSDWRTVDQMISAGFQSPAPGSYLSRQGKTVKFNSGEVDTWIWLVDYTRLLQRTPSPGTDDLLLEAYLLQHPDVDASVFVLGGQAAAQNLEAAYRAA